MSPRKPYTIAFSLKRRITSPLHNSASNLGAHPPSPPHLDRHLTPRPSLPIAETRAPSKILESNDSKTTPRSFRPPTLANLSPKRSPGVVAVLLLLLPPLQASVSGSSCNSAAGARRPAAPGCTRAAARADPALALRLKRLMRCLVQVHANAKTAA